MFDVIVIGAGIAGLVCAQQLQQAGYQVIVVEKSRGVGGRVATRRLHGTVADHGACYLKSDSEYVQQFVKILEARNILQVWTDTVYELDEANKLVAAKQYPRYVAPMGMSAIAKFLAQGLDIRFNQRVTAINYTHNGWHLICDQNHETPLELTATAIVLAIPSPQALTLLEPLAPTTLTPTFLDSLRLVEFAPCLSVMAGYPSQREQDLDKLQLVWKACTLKNSDLAWIGLDSSKRLNSQQPVFVLQSSADFAQRYLEAEDLNLAAQHLLSSAARLIPWLDTLEWFQIHRWRYAFPSRFLNQDCLDAATALPLVCCGDWCRGNLIAGAMDSGLAAAVTVNKQLQQKPLPKDRYLEAIAAYSDS